MTRKLRCAEPQAGFDPGCSVGTSQRSKLEPAYGKTCGKDSTCLVKTGLEV